VLLSTNFWGSEIKNEYIGNTRRACKILVTKPEGNRQFKSSSYKQDNIKMNVKETW
jgi:hypothetical protein